MVMTHNLKNTILNIQKEMPKRQITKGGKIQWTLPPTLR